MRLSEAIVLGSTNVRLNCNHWLREDHPYGSTFSGCLLGMGFYALTGRYVPIYAGEIMERWPWLSTKLVQVPCTHSSESSYLRLEDNSGLYRAIWAISHVAEDVHCGDLTFEQAIDWIRSIEPTEEEIKPTQEQQEQPEGEKVCA